ncbi:hypothetical protein PV11_05840 [Exophiala sideris]|uniref:BZIP domain-containing protein n=1 Tax=Exophiala sideris TaxID=1016849 RepID=A0A0D1X7N2_9EURO|nr:hypothetical protein PV11_05840 [Exophiala sideris]
MASRGKDYPVELDVKHPAGDKERRKSAITEARRVQNRRARRAFRERRRQKKKKLPEPKTRQLAPRPNNGTGADVSVRLPDTELLGHTLLKEVAGDEDIFTFSSHRPFTLLKTASRSVAHRFQSS